MEKYYVIKAKRSVISQKEQILSFNSPEKLEM